ncbi:MAG: DUF4274 domain-containing protein [Thermonemataceae bacterium]
MIPKDIEKYEKLTFDEIEEKIWAEYLVEASTINIHRSVIDANWDGNHYLLQWIKDNPQVDRATILIAYWMSAPQWFKQYATREESSNPASIDWLEEVEQKYLAGFYQLTTIAMDPASDQDGYDWTSEYTDLVLKRSIPKVMYQKLPGEVVERPEEGFEEGLPLTYAQKLNDIITYLYE